MWIEALRVRFSVGCIIGANQGSVNVKKLILLDMKTSKRRYDQEPAGKPFAVARSFDRLSILDSNLSSKGSQWLRLKARSKKNQLPMA